MGENGYFKKVESQMGDTTNIKVNNVIGSRELMQFSSGEIHCYSIGKVEEETIERAKGQILLLL